MTNGTYTTASGERVQVTQTPTGGYVIRNIATGTTTVIGGN